jgi:pilus assembly protein CpaB
MSRRRRAIVFAMLALMAAVGAALVADRYGARVAGSYGALRPVVVVGAPIPAGRRLEPEAIASDLAVRRVPARFVPPGALLAPEEALGLVARAPLPVGSYLLAAQLEVPRGRAPHRLLGDRRRVAISVSGADALLAAGLPAPGSGVDVVVTSEPRGAGPGRTFVAAADVPLLSLRPGAEGPGPGTLATATLALTEDQALRLIAAESFARKVTLLPRG